MLLSELRRLAEPISKLWNGRPPATWFRGGRTLLVAENAEVRRFAGRLSALVRAVCSNRFAMRRRRPRPWKYLLLDELDRSQLTARPRDCHLRKEAVPEG